MVFAIHLATNPLTSSHHPTTQPLTPTLHTTHQTPHILHWNHTHTDHSHQARRKTLDCQQNTEVKVLDCPQIPCSGKHENVDAKVLDCQQNPCSGKHENADAKVLDCLQPPISHGEIREHRCKSYGGHSVGNSEVHAAPSEGIKSNRDKNGSGRDSELCLHQERWQ